MAPKLIILQHVHCKQPHCNMASLITQFVSMDPKGSIIMRLACTDMSILALKFVFQRYQKKSFQHIVQR